VREAITHRFDRTNTPLAEEMRRVDE